MGKISDEFNKEFMFKRTDGKEYPHSFTDNYVNTKFGGGALHSLIDETKGRTHEAIKALEDELTSSDYTEHTQTANIASLPAGSVDGGISRFEYEGMTLVNSVVNGDFSDGGTNWANSNGSFVDGSVILDGDSERVEVTLSYTSKINFKLGDEIAILADYYTTDNTKSLENFLFSPSGNLNITFSLSGSNMWETKMIKFVAIGEASAIAFRLDNNNENDDINVYVKNVYFINMTRLGIEDYTEEQMLSLVRGGYFEGVKSVENPLVETVGKNLFDINGETRIRASNYKDQFYISNNKIIFSGGSSSNMFGVLTKVESNTTYTAYIGDTSCNNSHVRIGVYSSKPDYLYVSDEEAFIALLSYTNPITFTTPSNAEYVSILMYTSGLGAGDYIGDIQLEKSSTATSYEPYKSSKLQIETPLRRLPNGVVDRIYESNGEVWLEKNVEEYVLQESDMVGTQSGTVNKMIYTGVPPFPKEGYFNHEANIFTETLAPNTNVNWDSLTTQNTIWGNANGRVYMIFAIDKYASLEEAQADLTGTKILYQLAQPELINLTSQLKASGLLESYENGTMYLGNSTQLKNIITDGNFLSLDDNWSNLNSYSQYEDDYIETIATSDTDEIGIQSYVKEEVSSGDEILFFTRVKSTENYGDVLKITSQSGIDFTSASTVDADGKWHDLYAVGICDGSASTPPIEIRMNGTISSGELFLIDKKIGTFAINLTKLDIADVPIAAIIEKLKLQFFEAEGAFIKNNSAITGEFKADIPVNQASRVDGAVEGVNANAKQIANVQDVVNLIIAGL